VNVPGLAPHLKWGVPGISPEAAPQAIVVAQQQGLIPVIVDNVVVDIRRPTGAEMAQQAMPQPQVQAQAPVQAQPAAQAPAMLPPALPVAAAPAVPNNAGQQAPLSARDIQQSYAELKELEGRLASVPPATWTLVVLGYIKPRKHLHRFFKARGIRAGLLEAGCDPSLVDTLIPKLQQLRQNAPPDSEIADALGVVDLS
jgi:hypothetical protein